MSMILEKKMAVNGRARKLSCLLTFVIQGQSFVFPEKSDRNKASKASSCQNPANGCNRNLVGSHWYRDPKGVKNLRHLFN